MPPRHGDRSFHVVGKKRAIQCKPEGSGAFVNLLRPQVSSSKAIENSPPPMSCPHGGNPLIVGIQHSNSLGP